MDNVLVTGSSSLTGSLDVTGSVYLTLDKSDKNDLVTFDTTTNQVYYDTRKYTTQFTTVSLTNNYTITHNLNTSDLHINLRDNGTRQIYYPSITAGAEPQFTAAIQNSNQIQISFSSPVGGIVYDVVVTK